MKVEIQFDFHLTQKYRDLNHEERFFKYKHIRDRKNFQIYFFNAK